MTPQFLKIATPRSSILDFFRSDGQGREMLRQAQEQEKEMQEQIKRQREKERENKKKADEERKRKLAAPIMLFQNCNMQHPDDVPDKTKFSLRKLRRLKHQQHLYLELLRQQKLFPFNNNYKNVK